MKIQESVIALTASCLQLFSVLNSNACCSVLGILWREQVKTETTGVSQKTLWIEFIEKLLID